MLSLVLTVLAAQAQAQAETPGRAGVVVLMVRHEGLSAIESAALADRFGRALTEAQVPLSMTAEAARAKVGSRKAEACRGKPRCLADLGRTLETSAIVALDAGKIFDELAIRIVVVEPKAARVLSDRSATVSSEKVEALDAVLGRAATQVAGAVAELPGFAPPQVAQPAEKAPPVEPQVEPPPPVATRPPADAPRSTPPPVLEPRPVEPNVMTEPRPTPVLRYVAGGGAIASGVVGVTFLSLGLAQYGELQRHHVLGGGQPADVPLSQAQRMVDTANRDFLVASLCGGVAAALAATVFLVPESPAPAK